MAIYDTTWYLNGGDGSTTGYWGITQWASGTAYAAGTIRRQLATPAVGSERAFVCVVAGTSGGSEPTWVLTYGAKTTDNTVTWMEVTGRTGVNGDTTNTPTVASLRSKAVVLGQMMYDSVSGSIQICTTAGTCSASTPSYSATAGVTTTDGGATYTSLGLASGFAAFSTPFARMQTPAGTGFMAVDNTCWVSDTHTETQSASMTISTGNGVANRPLKFLCCNGTASAPPTALSTGALVSTTGTYDITLISKNAAAGGVCSYGIHFKAGIGSSSAVSLVVGVGAVADTCSLEMASSYSGSSSYCNIVNMGVCKSCTVLLQNASQFLNCTNTANAQIALYDRCTFFSSGAVPNVLVKPSITFGAASQNILFRNCDLSNVTGTLVDLTYWQVGKIVFENCKLAAGVTVTTGTWSGALSYPQNGSYVLISNSDSGATNDRYHKESVCGTVKKETTVTRAGGWSNGIETISLNLTTATNVGYFSPLSTEYFYSYSRTTGSSVTVTMYIASSSALTDKDVWMEVEYLGSAATPLGTLVTTQAAYFTSASALTSDASTWNSPPAHIYKITKTFTQNMEGPIRARLFVAASGTTVYVDPKIYLS